MLDSEIKLAIKEVKRAENQFNNADKDRVNFAINELMIAEENLNNLLKRKKQQNKRRLNIEI